MAYARWNLGRRRSGHCSSQPSQRERIRSISRASRQRSFQFRFSNGLPGRLCARLRYSLAVGRHVEMKPKSGPSQATATRSRLAARSPNSSPGLGHVASRAVSFLSEAVRAGRGPRRVVHIETGVACSLAHFQNWSRQKGSASELWYGFAVAPAVTRTRIVRQPGSSLSAHRRRGNGSVEQQRLSNPGSCTRSGALALRSADPALIQKIGGSGDRTWGLVGPGPIRQFFKETRQWKSTCTK